MKGKWMEWKETRRKEQYRSEISEAYEIQVKGVTFNLI
jgi:hypothetical protein